MSKSTQEDRETVEERQYTEAEHRGGEGDTECKLGDKLKGDWGETREKLD